MKAVVKDGAIQLREPLPVDWSEGTELEINKTSDPGTARVVDDDLDRWHAEVEAGCAQMDMDDDRILRAAVLEVRREEKARAHREAGLAE